MSGYYVFHQNEEYLSAKHLEGGPEKGARGKCLFLLSLNTLLILDDLSSSAVPREDHCVTLCKNCTTICEIHVPASSRFFSEGVTGSITLGGLETPHDQQQPQKVLPLATHHDGATCNQKQRRNYRFEPGGKLS